MSADQERLDKSSRIITVLVPLVLVLLVVVLKLPVLHTPYYWDEAGAYFAPSLWLSSRDLVDAFPGRHAAEIFFGHPPLLYLSTAFLFKLFGPAPAVAHLPIILFAAFGVLYTYKTGVLLFSREIGIGAAVMLISSPLYFTQSGMFLGDIPVAACSVAAVFYYLRRSSYRYLLFGTVAVLIKEHAALLILLLVLYEFRKSSGDAAINRRRLLLSAPLMILGIFFLMQKLMTGSFLPNPYFNSNPFLSIAPSKLAFKIAFVNYWAFFAQGRFLITMVIMIAVWRFRRSLPEAFPLFALIIGGYVAAYSVIYFIPRYILIVMPFICLLGSASLALLVQNKLRFAAAVAAFALTFIHIPDLRSRGYDNFETSMQYLDVVSIHRQAASFLEQAGSGELIYAPWPLSSVWAKTDYGYLKTPLKMTSDSNSSWKYVVQTPQADRAQVEAIGVLISRGGLVNVAHFECSGKVIDILSRKVSVPKG